MSENIHQLNYALVETTRPSMYSSLKYWGKKPVNIWREFIDCYCPEGGVVFDPFAGSDIVAFEAALLGKKSISFDLNPMSTFMLELLSWKGDIATIEENAKDIISAVEADETYKRNFLIPCNQVSRLFKNEIPVSIQRLIEDGKDDILEVQNYYWSAGDIKKVRLKKYDGAKFPRGSGAKWPEINEGLVADNLKDELGDIVINDWYPTDKFPDNSEISASFLSAAGGNDFSYLWTRRNLYVLARIFQLIMAMDEQSRLPLLGGFVHALHLTSKMVVPRSEKGDRAYSGSWGRAAYMIRTRQLEQNPLMVFSRGIFDKQGVIAAVSNCRKRIPDVEKLKLNIVGGGKKKLSKTAQINYGTIDIADALDYVKDGSVDFILTDPPYGGLVQYMDLSLVWLVWLQKADARYTPDNAGEITYKKGIVPREEYKNKLVNAFRVMYRALKDDGHLVVTFHSQKIKEWNDLVASLRLSGFVVDKVTHQYNLRSGEANVANPYGTSASDFYIRCVKHRGVDFTDDHSNLERFVQQKAIQIVAARYEPTPFEFLTNGLLPEMIQAGYLGFDEPAKEIFEILKKDIGDDKIFKVSEGDPSLGATWWFNKPEQYIKHIDIPLQDRVEEAVLALLRRKISVSLDDVIGEIFKEFPNGLTPNIRGLQNVLQDYAVKSQGKWKLKESVEKEATLHTQLIENICRAGIKNGYHVCVGRREQPETVGSGKALKDAYKIENLAEISAGKNLDSTQLGRVEQIDAIWCNDEALDIVFEVETTTKFLTAIARGSNLDKGVKKIMVIPDAREDEFLRTIRDPQVRNSFVAYNWRYALSSDFLLNLKGCSENFASKVYEKAISVQVV